MTKKPIMIDDVNVAECIHRIRKNEHCTYCNAYSSKVFDFDCSDFPNCYYKQLKRKEQECEELLKFNNSLVEEHKTIGNDLYKEIKDYRKKLQAKEQECEELMKELHKNFEEKDKLHLIIDRLLEASGYDTNIASAEDFEDVYENMSYEKLQLYQLKADNEKMEKGYIELTEIVSPYIDDFTGYNEELQGFDIVLCVKELIQQLNDKDNKRITILTATNDQLKAENKKLKELVKTRIEDLCDSCGASSMMPMPCKVYEQTLQEIKEIAEQMNNECFYDDFDCEDCDMKKGCTHFNKKQILLKYEVLDG